MFYLKGIFSRVGFGHHLLWLRDLEHGGSLVAVLSAGLGSTLARKLVGHQLENKNSLDAIIDFKSYQMPK